MKIPTPRTTNHVPSAPWSGNVFTIVGDRFCVASDDGEKVYRLVRRAFESKKNVTLSFEGIESLSSAFLNSAIGQFLKDYTREELQTCLRVEDLNADDELLLQRVIANAERYFSDPQRFSERREEILFSS